MPEDEANTGTAAAKRRKLMMLAKDCGLDQDDRMQLAQFLLRRDITSWASLSESQIDRLLDCFEGYFLIGELRSQKVY